METIQHLLERLSLDNRLALEQWLREREVLQGREDGVEEARVAYASDPPFMNLEEFFVFEKNSPIRHEYLNGAVYAMAGPSVAHERIKQNLVMVLGNHLGRGPCQVFSSAMQLRIRHDMNEICYHPDIMVDCQRESWEANFVVNPKLVVEVLSPLDAPYRSKGKAAELSPHRLGGRVRPRGAGGAKADNLPTRQWVATSGPRRSGGDRRAPFGGASRTAERDLRRCFRFSARFHIAGGGPMPWNSR